MVTNGQANNFTAKLTSKPATHYLCINFGFKTVGSSELQMQYKFSQFFQMLHNTLKSSEPFFAIGMMRTTLLNSTLQLHLFISSRLLWRGTNKKRVKFKTVKATLIFWEQDFENCRPLIWTAPFLAGFTCDFNKLQQRIVEHEHF